MSEDTVGTDSGDQLAQSTTGPTTGPIAEPIGVVMTANGTVTVERADGSVDQLGAGDPVYEDDVLTTADDSTVGIRFADDSRFSLGEDGQLSLDTFVYDPASETGTSLIDVAQGSFAFVSGMIAKTGDDAMSVQTPVATIGVRGTTVAGDVAPDGQTEITLLPDTDGTLGEIAVFNDGGLQIMFDAFQRVDISGSDLSPTAPRTIDPSDIRPDIADTLRAIGADPSGAPRDDDGGGADPDAEADPAAPDIEIPGDQAVEPTDAEMEAAATEVAEIAVSAGGDGAIIRMTDGTELEVSAGDLNSATAIGQNGALIDLGDALSGSARAYNDLQSIDEEDDAGVRNAPSTFRNESLQFDGSIPNIDTLGNSGSDTINFSPEILLALQSADEAEDNILNPPDGGEILDPETIEQSVTGWLEPDDQSGVDLGIIPTLPPEVHGVPADEIGEPQLTVEPPSAGFDIGGEFEIAPIETALAGLENGIGDSDGIVSQIVENITDPNTGTTDSGSDDNENTVHTLNDTVQDTLDELTDGADDTVETITETVDETVNDVTDTAQDTLDELTDDADDTVETITETVDETVNDVTDTAQDTLDKLTDGADDTVETITETVDETVNDVTDTAQDTLDELTDGADDTVETITETVDETVNDVTDTAQDTLDELTDSADDIVQGLTEPVQELFNLSAPDSYIGEETEEDDTVDGPVAEEDPAPSPPQDDSPLTVQNSLDFGDALDETLDDLEDIAGSVVQDLDLDGDDLSDENESDPDLLEQLNLGETVDSAQNLLDNFLHPDDPESPPEDSPTADSGDDAGGGETGGNGETGIIGNVFTGIFGGGGDDDQQGGGNGLF